MYFKQKFYCLYFLRSSEKFLSFWVRPGTPTRATNLVLWLITSTHPWSLQWRVVLTIIWSLLMIPQQDQSTPLQGPRVPTAHLLRARGRQKNIKDIKTMMILVLQDISEMASITDKAWLQELGVPLTMAHTEFRKILGRPNPGTPHSPDWDRFLWALFRERTLLCLGFIHPPTF